MRYIFINHGFMGSNIENWFPYIKESLDDNNNQVIIPREFISFKKENCFKPL